MKEPNGWTDIIEPKRNILQVDYREIWKNKDLLILFVKRDFVTVYKQTILGPLWFLIEPILSTIIFTIIFGRIAGISTNSIPQPLFYLAGLTIWNYYAECLKKTSDTFIENQHIFGKVYFPRIITPLSIVISALLKFTIQFILFLFVYIYYWSQDYSGIDPNRYLLIFPILIILTGLMSLSIGMIISSLTTKYRDLRFLIQFGIQLWMYASPIIYPLSTVQGKMRNLLILNPMTGIIESFKFGFFGEGIFSWSLLAYSALSTFVLLFVATIIFNKTEQNFMDTV